MCYVKNTRLTKHVFEKERFDMVNTRGIQNIKENALVKISKK